MPRRYRSPRRAKTSREELTPAQRNQILGAAASGEKPMHIARRLDIPKTSVYRTIEQGPERTERGQKSNPRSGPRKTTVDDDTLLAEAAMVAPLQPLRELNTNIMPTVSHRTIQRRIKEQKLAKHRQRPKPLLTGKHRQKQLTWALEHENWTYDDWKKVVWSDECSVELGSGYGRPWVFYRIGANLEDTDCVETRKRVRVMIWGAFYGETKGEAVVLKGDPGSTRGGVTAERYLACLKEYFLGLMQGKGKIFMHDGAPIHTANLIKDWLSE